VRSIQTELKRVGCDPGAIDGRWGPGVRRALALFARHAKASIGTEAPTDEALTAITGRKGRVCPLECDDDEIEVNGQCVPKPAPKPQAKTAPKPAAPAAPVPPKAPAATPGSGPRRCRAFPRPRIGEACIGVGGRECVYGGGAGSCR
jgi:peptidoglycan hydrolase-like protein with peptidoglycan-binding domain